MGHLCNGLYPCPTHNKNIWLAAARNVPIKIPLKDIPFSGTDSGSNERVRCQDLHLRLYAILDSTGGCSSLS